MKAAIYCRVSTKKEEQNPETQLIPCRKFCEQNGWVVVDEYVDRITGRNQRRPQLQRLYKDAVYRRFDNVVVWKMDRLSRGGIRDTYNALDKLTKYTIKVYSVTEPILSTDNPASELILAVLAWAAGQESRNIGERVKAGIDRWKKENPGKRWRGKQWDIDLAVELRKNGMGWRSIERELRERGYDVTYAAVRKELLVNHGFEKGVNLPSKNLTGKSKSENGGC